MRWYRNIFIALIISVSAYLVILPFVQVPTLSCTGYVNNDKLSAGYDPQNTQGEFMGEIVYSPMLPENNLFAQVLGETTNKRIEVDLARQRVYAFEGGNKVFDFLVSTGKWAPTPKGTFYIARKIRAQAMTGGNRANGTYYYLPNVPYVMFFGNNQIPWTRGFSFHGTYWHNNFGTPMSHGCVNMKTSDAGSLYNWAPAGTKVVIY